MSQSNQAEGQQFPIREYGDFYKFYLTEHQNIASRRLHVTGSALGLFALYRAVKTGRKRYVVYGLVAGYACAWTGHFFFEKNKPASFKQPFYSFISDWRMLSDVVRGRVSLISSDLDKAV